MKKMFNQIKDKVLLASIIAPVYAAGTDINIKPTGNNFTGLTSLTAGGIISGAINLVLIVVALVFFFILVFGGLKWVTSGGDEKKVAAARAQITNALIGLAIVFAAWAIMKLIETVFGISIFNFSVPTFQ